VWLLGAALIAVAGCARKAPGPDECRGMALGAVGMTEEQLRRFPELQQAAAELTNDCLTMPFDRKLIDCVSSGRDYRVCFLEFQLRQREAGREELTPRASRRGLQRQ